MDQRALPAALILAACSPADPAVPPADNVVEVANFPATPTRDLDLIVQMDDSSSTAEFQLNFGKAMPALLDSLVVDGALPNLHVAVVTSDLGTTGSLDPANPGPPVGQVGQGGCAAAGHDGAFFTAGQFADAFLVDEDDGAGGRRTNYTGALADVLEKMMFVGALGCGFEQPLAATRRGLTRPDQAAFLRASASLAVIVVADEDDCSVLDPAFFDPDAPLGPLQSFRCTREGVACAEPLDREGDKHACAPREDSAFVEGIAPYQQFFASLKPRAEQLVIGAVVGDPAVFAIETRTISGQPQLALGHSCSWSTPTGPSVADPPVRLAALVDGARSRGVRTPVCQPDLAPNVQLVGMAIKRSLGVACITTAPLVQPPHCEVHDVDAMGIVTVIPECPDAGTCYELRADPDACPESADHARVVVTRAEPPADGTHVEVRCETN